MRAWRVEYAAMFHVSPRDMADMYPAQLLAMDEQIDDMRREQGR